jgi:hypothetical protein
MSLPRYSYRQTQSYTCPAVRSSDLAMRWDSLWTASGSNNVLHEVSYFVQVPCYV